MPSEYDALLTATAPAAPTPNPYDALLAATAEPEKKQANPLDVFGYDVAHASTTAVQGMFRGLQSIASDEQKKKVLQDSIDALDQWKNEKLPKYYGVTPEDQKTTAGKIVGAAATAGDIALGPGPMIAKLAGQTYSDAYDQSARKLLSEGNADAGTIRDQASAAARGAVIKMAPTLALYAASGTVGKLGADALLPETAGPLLRAAAGGATSAAANLATSATLRAVQGEPVVGDLQQNLTDVFFGAPGALHPAFTRPKTAEPRIGLGDVNVPQPGTELAGGDINAISDQASIAPGIAPSGPETGGAEGFARYQAGETRAPIATAGPPEGGGGGAPSQVEGVRETTGGGGQEGGGTQEGEALPIGPQPGAGEGPQGGDQISGASEPVAEPAPGRAASGAAPGVAAEPAIVDLGTPQTLKSFAELPAPVAKRPAPIKGDGGYSENPLIQFIRDEVGGILSRSGARAKLGKAAFENNKSLWDTAPEFPDPRHNKIYNAKTGVMPDEAASAAVDAGLLPQGSDASTLFNNIQKIADSSHRVAAQERAQTAEIKTGEKQYRSFTSAIAKQSKGERPISASDLQVGDHVTVNGEKLKVIDIDPDNYDVTLEDGAKFGVQHVADQQVFYGEHTPATPRLTEAQRVLMGKLEAAEGSLTKRGRAQLERLRAIERPAVLQLRPGEKGTADLFQAQDQPFNLAGETGIDYAARQRAADEAAAAKAEADAKTEADQTQLFPEALKLRARAGEAGFFNADHLQAAADFGQRIYKAGMDFVRWSAHMIRQLGDMIRPHLAGIWNSFTGDNILPHARERGGTSRNLSQEEIEGAANHPEKMREHIKTVQRMTEVSADVKERVESWYTPIKLKEVNARANATIDQVGLGKAQDAFLKSRSVTSDTFPLGHHIALRLDALGRYDEAAEVRNAMAEKATAPAQSLWYISTIAKTSPEGLIREATKIVTDQIAGDPAKLQTLADIKKVQDQLTSQPPGAVRDMQITSTLQQLQNVNKPGQRLSAAFVDGLIKRHRDGLLTPEELGDKIAKHLGVPKLTAANIAEIKEAQRLYAAAEAAGDPIMALKRGADMMDKVYGLVPRSFWDKVRATAVISMILHGRLPFRIGVSNTIKLAGQTAVDAIENVPRDIGRVFTGQRTITGDQLRAIAQGLKEPEYAFQAGYADAKARGLALWPSFKEGMRTMLDMASMTTRGIFELSDIKARNTHTFSSRFGRLTEDMVTLIHNVVPYAFWNAGFKSSLVRQMRIAGANVPTEEMVAGARLDANKAIFQNETMIYKTLLGLRKTLDIPTAALTKGKYGFGTATIPFAKVPGALLTEGATWTPIGFIKAGWEGIGRPLLKLEFRGKEAADALIKAALGTGSTVLTGYWLAKLGVITGAPDENRDIEAMRKALGWGAYRINLSELKRRFLSGNFTARSLTPETGDVIINYNWAEPVAVGVAMGADMAHSAQKREIDIRKGKLTSNAVVSAIGAGVGSLTEAPMLQGIQNLTTNYAERGAGSAALGILANVPGNFVPSLIRQWTQYIDNTVRETRGGSMVDVEANRIMAQIPGLSAKYPARYDVFGDAVQRYNYGNNSVLNVFFNPAQISKFKSNPEVAEMMRLFETTGSGAALPKQVEKTLTVNGKQVQLDNEMLATYQRYIGKESSAVVTRLLASPQFAAAPDYIKQSVISEVMSAVHTSAKIDLFGEQPVKIKQGGLQGPSVSAPSFLDMAALLDARRKGLTQKAEPAMP